MDNLFLMDITKTNHCIKMLSSDLQLKCQCNWHNW